MGNNKRNKLCILGISIILTLILSSCNHTKPVIIDGAKAREIENRINVLAFDEDIVMRGNTPSNIRNGGNLIMDGDNLYVIQEMQFNKDTSYYLQQIYIPSIGSLSARNDLLDYLNGTIVALIDNTIFFLDSETSLAYSLNLISLETSLLFVDPVSSFRVFDNTGYVSTKEGHHIYSLSLNATNDAKLLVENGGIILDFNNSMIYTLEDGQNNKVINGYDRKDGTKNFSLTGGPFIDAQITGSFVYFKHGDTLRRLLLDDTCECTSASVLRAAEYAIFGQHLVISSPEKGLYLSNLDGSHIVMLSEDRGKDIQLFDDLLFYRNEHDYNEWYVIQFSNQSRSALIGETVTDGGSKFIKADASLSDSYSSFYEYFIDSVKHVTSNKNGIQQKLGSDILFVDTRGNGYEYYTHLDYPFTPQECDAIVVITNKDTLLGKYTDGGKAYRKDTVLTIFQVGDESPLLSDVTQGSPPIDIKHGKGDRFGLPVSWHQMGLAIIERMK